MAEKHKEIDKYGNVYKGDIHNGKWHGSGTLLYAESGDVYHGDFEKGVPHGAGKYLRDGGKNGKKDGVYEGLWHNGVLQQVKKGRAKITLDNGDVYDGGFHHWKRHGIGKLIKNDGEIYEGQWKEGMRHGPGKITYPDGAFYEGYFRNDEAVAQGGDGDQPTKASQDLGLNQYQQAVSVPRTISFQSGRGRGRDDFDYYEEEEYERRDVNSRGQVQKERPSTTNSEAANAKDILEMKRLQLERLKDGDCLRKFAQKNVTKLERKQSKQADPEKKKLFSLFKRKKKKDESKVVSATEQFVDGDNLEFFDFEEASGVGPNSSPSPYEGKPQKSLSLPRLPKKSRSPSPRSSSRMRHRSHQPESDDYGEPASSHRPSANRLPARPQNYSRSRYDDPVDYSRANSRGRSRSAQREMRDSMHNTRGRSLSTPRQSQGHGDYPTRGRSSSRPRERELSSPRHSQNHGEYSTRERSSSRAHGRELSAPRSSRGTGEYSSRERSSSRARERSLSAPRQSRDDAYQSSGRHSSRTRDRTPLRSRQDHDRARPGRSSSVSRQQREKGALPPSRKEKPMLDSRARKEALLKKYNIPNHKSISGMVGKDSVHSRTSKRSDYNGLRSIDMKGKSGTAQMLYVNQKSDDDSEFFMK